MMNYLWGFMLLLGIAYATITNSLPELTNGMLAACQDAVNLCISMLGILGFWCGLMEIAKQSGLITKLTTCLRPILRFLYPSLPDTHPATEQIATNTIANILGLGWAATPSGLRAMKLLQQTKACPSEIASSDMCMFLLINISSLQLIPINMIAYRTEYGSTAPTNIIGPALLATSVSTIVAIIFGMLCQHHERRTK